MSSESVKWLVQSIIAFGGIAGFAQLILLPLTRRRARADTSAVESTITAKLDETAQRQIDRAERYARRADRRSERVERYVEMLKRHIEEQDECIRELGGTPKAMPGWPPWDDRDDEPATDPKES